MIDPTIFRAYDIRGIVGETLTLEAVTAIGRAFAAMVREASGKARPEIAVGYDGRLSSPDIEAALVTGFNAAGADAVRVGLGPTPMLYFAVHHLDADAGVMVTGSHNPPDYNGLKMMMGTGPFHGEQIQEVARRTSDTSDGAEEHGSSRMVDLSVDYVARVQRDAVAGRELKVVWDAGNGAAGSVLGDLVAGLPGQHTVLFGEVDGTFPNHHPDPTVPENLEDLIAAVAEQGADLGIALDGDGDRIGVIDGEGNVLWGDQLLAFWAADLLGEQPGATIIADVKASQVLFDEIARLGGQPLMWRTGHSLIKQKMKEVGCPLAGEMSGHVFFADRYYGFDDALYAAVRLLNVLAGRDQSLASYRRGLPQVVNTPELRFDCDDVRKFVVIEEVRARLVDRGDDVVDVDGVRVSVAGGWWLLRASNTQPVLVARCEAPDAASLEAVKKDLLDVVTPSVITPPRL
ncbi:MAG: phosphomannomutase/phosphoglucomutase [Rhodospirillales bacterium]|nr:phosphomannomutase/phosphoglucomutase [Rhodospirillales bacterium]